jgi:transposase-like protein
MVCSRRPSTGRRKFAEVAKLLGISEQTIYIWRRQHLIDTGQMLGLPPISRPNWPRPQADR